MNSRNATAAVIGAGDYIGAAIVRKFAAEGFTVFAGRRSGDKLAPLVADVEAHGGHIVARALDARNEADITAFLVDRGWGLRAVYDVKYSILTGEPIQADMLFVRR